MITQLTEDNFDAAVALAPGTHVIRFWAGWCKPCSMILPIFMHVADEFKAAAHFAEVNIDEQPNLAAQFHIRSIPTIVVVKDGQALESNVGLSDKSKLSQLVMRHVA
ncbi:MULTISPECIES: thioredoxin [unclassified Burkholderia]|uniref:thioredoxin n=1 Tax=unclassified Burkholderia TaxID=2613784 RepID=UPI002AB07114|nr:MULTISPECIES: thioredoxin [unclassified Burkholderia]